MAQVSRSRRRGPQGAGRSGHFRARGRALRSGQRAVADPRRCRRRRPARRQIGHARSQWLEGVRPRRDGSGGRAGARRGRGSGIERRRHRAAHGFVLQRSPHFGGRRTEQLRSSAVRQFGGGGRRLAIGHGVLRDVIDVDGVRSAALASAGIETSVDRRPADRRDLRQGRGAPDRPRARLAQHHAVGRRHQLRTPRPRGARRGYRLGDGRSRDLRFRRPSINARPAKAPIAAIVRV